jgi:hypothetical protein
MLRFLILLLVIGGFCGRTLADGKFFVPEKIPANVPYQRALLLFYNGSETLVLQSKYELSQSADANSLGWIVPVPAVPEVASVDPGIARFFFFNASLWTQPDLFSISSIFLLIGAPFFLVCFAFLLVLLLEYPFEQSKVVWRRRFRNSLIMTLAAFVLTIMGIPHLGSSGDVEVIKAQKVGIYDVKVIRSQNAEGIVGWLKENSFSFSESDVQVFEDYVNRQWCFVVAKVEADPGMVAPLILKFQTGTAVYPLALTSTIGADTEVLLYTLSEKKLSCSERLTLRRARNTKPASLIRNLLMGAEPKTTALFAEMPESMIICKFKKKLKPEEMEKDLEFEFAPDNDPYVETKVVW